MNLAKASLTLILKPRYELVFLLLLSTIALTQQAAIDSTTDFYTAGVVEFRNAASVADNLAGYLEIIASPNASATDIIVFPEATLGNFNSYDFVPSPQQQVTPCLDDPEAQYYADYLVAISCAARNVSKYVAINVPEHELCTDVPEDTRPCASNGFNIYNTNVVFDRNGTVISRYRKVHLYGEPRNTTFVPESITFETDFGVTFGHMICFDIMFFTPGGEIILEQGVRDFIFPTMWFSQLPFLTAVQTQLAWAYANDANLLAAGASHPENGSTGSGIYNGRKGTISSVMALDEGQRRIYVAQVPKYPASSRRTSKRSRRAVKEQPQPRNTEGFQMKQDLVTRYETVSLESLTDQATDTSLTQDVCHGQICCHFEVEWRLLDNVAENVSYYSYRLAAYDGWRNEKGMDENYLRNCGIFACTGPSIEDCGKLVHAFQPRVTFTRLLIEAAYPKSREFLLAPSSVRDNLLPLEPHQFEFSLEELANQNQLQSRFELAPSLEVQNLLTFAIYGNYYDDECTFNKGTEQEDLECGFQPKDDGAASLRFSSFFAAATAVDNASEASLVATTTTNYIVLASFSFFFC
ncbi:vanin-like protein 2 [Drosophila nasuta]|uniref:vanin-like protein 2 n=1 Tax=Drosophila nasuta TaxID=42062 RepID=UPI00295EF032|nr:vanin-like protein 2 [Drosophila nasuta]